jgi:hypothetical protein
LGEIIHETRTGHPFWTWAFGIMIALFIALAIFAPDQPVEARAVLVFVSLCLLLAFPDMHAYFGTEGIKLTFGIGGIWKKRIPRDTVTRVCIVKFSGLRHFGGWGIKFGMGKFAGTLMWGMPVKGSRGVWVETNRGRKYLITDSDPEATLESIREYYPADVISADGI